MADATNWEKLSAYIKETCRPRFGGKFLHCVGGLPVNPKPPVEGRCWRGMMAGVEFEIWESTDGGLVVLAALEETQRPSALMLELIR